MDRSNYMAVSFGRLYQYPSCFLRITYWAYRIGYRVLPITFLAVSSATFSISILLFRKKIKALVISFPLPSTLPSVISLRMDWPNHWWPTYSAPLAYQWKTMGPCWWVCAYLLASTILVNDTLFSKKKSDESLLLTNLAMAIDFIFSWTHFR